jgi:hypothetical protein
MVAVAGIWWDGGAEVPGRGVGGVKGKADPTMTSIQRLKSTASPRKKSLRLSTLSALDSALRSVLQSRFIVSRLSAGPILRNDLSTSANVLEIEPQACR